MRPGVVILTDYPCEFSEGSAVSTDQQVELGTVSACPLSRREPDSLRAGLVSCNLGYSCAL